MPKRTATQKAIDNINSYIKDVANVYGKNSQEYEDVTNAIADYDIYTNNKGIIQVSNSKANRKAGGAALRTQAKQFSKARKSYRHTTARRQYQDTAKKQLHEMQKAFADTSSELYSLRDLCEQYNIEWDYLKGYRDKEYVNSKWQEVQRAESEYLRETYGQSVVHDYSNDVYYDPDTFEVIEWGYYLD